MQLHHPVIKPASRFYEDAPNVHLALETASNGIPVHAVCDATKRPMTLHGRNDATADQKAIREWWQRHPHALVSIPTGHASGVVVLDIDRGGETAFNEMLAKLQCETVDDLSPCWARTPGDGLHVYFRFEPGTSPESRSNDIAARIDTRALGGSIIIPGNIRQNGRAYEWGNPSASLHDAPAMPRRLLYLMTFNARERDLIAGTPPLLSQMKDAPAAEWRGIFQQWGDDDAKKLPHKLVLRSEVHV